MFSDAVNVEVWPVSSKRTMPYAPLLEMVFSVIEAVTEPEPFVSTIIPASLLLEILLSDNVTVAEPDVELYLIP